MSSEKLDKEELQKKKILECGNVRVKVPCHDSGVGDFVAVSNVVCNLGFVFDFGDDTVDWKDDVLYLLDTGFSISGNVVNYLDVLEVKIVRRGGWFSLHSEMVIVTKDGGVRFKILKGWADSFKSVLEEKILKEEIKT